MNFVYALWSNSIWRIYKKKWSTDRVDVWYLINIFIRAINVGGVGGWYTFQTYVLVGLQMSAVDLKI